MIQCTGFRFSHVFASSFVRPCNHRNSVAAFAEQSRAKSSSHKSRRPPKVGDHNKGPQFQRRDNRRVLNDFYFLEAKRKDYLSRAAFKLLQVDEKFKVLKKHGTILDLGCFPGAWLQVACQKLGPLEKGGTVVGIDLKEMNVPTTFCDERVTVLHGDARDLSKEALELFSPSGFDTVLSDMCHDTTGTTVADVGMSLDLCEVAAQIAIGNKFRVDEEDYNTMPSDVAAGLQAWDKGVLRSGGSLVMKILEGSGTKEFGDSLRPFFTKIGYLRPQATRKESREVYIVCMGRKQ